jgi:uncharacterized protein YndB with AHSA1/START domain
MDATTVPQIRLVLRTPVAPEVAWSYLTDPERVAEWFTSASPVGEVGEPYILDFGEGSVVNGAIVEVVPAAGLRTAGPGWTPSRARRPR